MFGGNTLSVRVPFDGIEQRCNNLFRVLERFVGRRLLELVQEVLFLFKGQGREIDARTVPVVSVRPAPGDHAVLMAAHLFLETGQTGLDRLARLDPYADHAEVNDPDNVFCPREPVRCVATEYR